MMRIGVLKDITKNTVEAPKPKKLKIVPKHIGHNLLANRVPTMLKNPVPARSPTTKLFLDFLIFEA